MNGATGTAAEPATAAGADTDEALDVLALCEIWLALDFSAAPSRETDHIPANPEESP